MLQQFRTIKGMLVLWGLSLAMIIAGCGGGEDTSTPINQEIPQHVASPNALSMQGFRFSTGEPFHIDPTVLVQGDVLLSFGDFKGTNSAPFTLVAGGFRATGTATWLNIYTLSIQESTFPAASSTQGARGPQVGDQLFIAIDLSTMNVKPHAQEVNFLNGERDFTRLKLVGKTSDISRLCDTKPGEGDPVDLGTLAPLGTLVPAGSGTSEGCIIVNGSINVQERAFADTFKLNIQPSDQIVQFILTFPTSTADDNGKVDFDFFIRRKDNLNITDNTNVLQSCVSTRSGQEACSIVLQQTDFAAGSPLPIEIQVHSASLTSGSLLGTGNYTLEILSDVSSEVGNRKNICPDTGPGTIQEREPNGSADLNPTTSGGFTFRVKPDPMLFQFVGPPLQTNRCLPIRGGKIAASISNNTETDAIDNYEFSVESTVPTVAFLLNPTNLTGNSFSLFIDEITVVEGKFTFNRLVTCQTTAAFETKRPSTPVTCAVSVPANRDLLRVGVFVNLACPTTACTSAISNYSLDIIAVAQPSIPVTPISDTSSPTGIITPQ